MTPGIRIRAFAAEDLQPLIALFRSTVRTVNLGDYTPAQVAAWAPETIDADRWAARIAAHRVWVAERDGALSGFIELGDGGYIVMLYVDAARQRRGVATALLDVVEATARAEGVGRLHTEASITAQPFFARHGFDTAASQTVRLRGETFLNYRMEKPLDRIADRMTLPDGYTDLPPGKIAAIVTSLEMTARPPARPEVQGHGWTVRQVPEPGLDWYRDLYRRIGSDWLWFSRLRMADERLRAIIHDPQVEVFALHADGNDEGLLELDFRVPGECELAFFGMTRRMLGQGAGRFLMNRAIARAWSRPIRRFWVHTCSLDHQAAPAFYQRSGFRPFRLQVEIDDDPRLIGVLPRDAAPHVPIIE